MDPSRRRSDGLAAAGLSAPFALLGLLGLLGCGSDGGHRVEGGGTITDPDPVAYRFSVVANGPEVPRITTDLWLHGDVAYTGTGCRGLVCGDQLYVWDIQDPSNIRLADSVLVDARRVNDVKIRADGTLAVLTHEGSLDRLNGITLLDLADPLHPTVITRYTGACASTRESSCLSRGVHNVWIEGHHVYAVEPRDGTHVIDISDPARPRQVALFQAGASRAHDVLVRDGLAFVSHMDDGLIILDVGHGTAGGSPANPVEVSRVDIPGGHVHNAWYWPERDYVFLGQETFTDPVGGMHVVDVTDLSAPVLVADYFLPDSPPHNFWLDETRGILFAAWYTNGLHAIDVSGDLSGDLTLQDRELASIRPTGPRGAGSIWAPQLHDGLVFASDVLNGLWAFRFTEE